MDASIADRHLVSLDGGPRDGERISVSEMLRVMLVVDLSPFSEKGVMYGGVYVRTNRDRMTWHTWSDLKTLDAEARRDVATVVNAFTREISNPWRARELMLSAPFEWPVAA